MKRLEVSKMTSWRFRPWLPQEMAFPFPCYTRSPEPQLQSRPNAFPARHRKTTRETRPSRDAGILEPWGLRKLGITSSEPQSLSIWILTVPAMPSVKRLAGERCSALSNDVLP